MVERSSGFSLVEIAVVLVIIGLLLGGMLKGQEMINSAKVRNLADMNSGISAAYFGFVDRYRRVPGDWDSSQASAALGVPITGGGNNNGRIDNPAGGADTFVEPNAVWEQLAKAGFLEGAYSGEPDPPDTNSNQTPLNAFNHVVLMGRTADYISTGASAVRLNLVMGRGVPVEIARELDVKVDDGVANTGILRLAIDIGSGATFGDLGESDPLCQNAGAFDVAADNQDCNTVFLY